jgi:hypothetical protein
MRFKTVKRILLSLNTDWEGITLGTDIHWMLGELHLETDHTHLYDWIEQSPEQYALVAGLAPSKQIMCTAPHVSVHPTDAYSRCVLHAAPLQVLPVVLHKRCVGLCQHPAIDHPNKRIQLSIHNAFAQQNSF